MCGYYIVSTAMRSVGTFWPLLQKDANFFNEYKSYLSIGFVIKNIYELFYVETIFISYYYSEFFFLVLPLFSVDF